MQEEHESTEGAWQSSRPSGRTAIWRRWRHRWRQTALARSYAGLLDRLAAWWYPPATAPLNRPTLAWYRWKRRWRHSMLAEGYGRLLDRLSTWWHPPRHAPLNRLAVVWFRWKRRWQYSALGQLHGRLLDWVYAWWYPPPEAGGNAGAFSANRLGCWGRQARAWGRRTWLGRKLGWLLDEVADQAVSMNAKIGALFSGPRLWAWVYRWQTAVSLVLLLATVGFAGRYGLLQYRLSQERRTARAAEQWLNQGDLKRALLSARVALDQNPSNTLATRVVADVADRSGVPETLYWRKRAAALMPDPTNQLALASAALRWERYPFPTATRTLEDIAPAFRQSAAYQRATAMLTLQRGNWPEAEQHFAEALRLDPTNATHRLSLAVLQLQSTNAQRRLEARSALEALRTNAHVGLMATRTLATESFDRKDFGRAEDLSLRILTNTHSTFRDRLFHLTILQARQSTNLLPFLEATKRQAATNLVQADELAVWLNSSGHAQTTLDWLGGLPPAFTEQGPLAVDIADAYAVLRKWEDLEHHVNRRSWIGLESIRSALLARALTKGAEARMDSMAWQNALRAASSSPDALARLANLTAAWGWRARTEEVLWRAFKAFPGQSWPQTQLTQLYVAKQDTAALRQVAVTVFERNPGDAKAANNYAALSLLLDQDLQRAHAIAAAMHSTNSGNAFYASTYALSLQKQGRAREAAALLAKLSPDQLNEPVIAVYFGIMLRAAGESATAAPYLAKTSLARLLPEERAMAEQARAGR